MMRALLDRVWSRRFLKFGVVGGAGTVVNVAVLWASREYVFARVARPGVRLNLALAAAIVAATLHNFVWNRAWTWADRVRTNERSWFAQFGQYMMACWLSIAVQAVVTNVFASHAYYLAANLGAIGMATILNYVANDLWTFGRSGPAA